LKSETRSTTVGSHHFVVTGEPVVVAPEFLQVRSRYFATWRAASAFSRQSMERSSALGRTGCCCSLELADQFYCRWLVSCKLG